MTATRPAINALRFAVTGALAGALLSGCTGAGNVAHLSRSVSQGQPEQDRGERAIAAAEAKVAQQPREAKLRVALAQLYLKAGRFESAATTYEDAMELGDDSGRTALSLALSYTALGHGSEAVQVLDEHRDAIAAEDFGLALALAGDSSRGVAILADALRNGEPSPKLRQNLAYAYALDGRWLEARLMVAQDVPADQIDARISSWATQGRPEDYQQRVASLLGTPLRTDSGQPQYLALSTNEPAQQQAQVSAPEGEMQPAASDQAELPPASAPAGEQLAVNSPSVPAVADEGSYAPYAGPVAAYEARGFEQAFAEPAPEPAAAPRPASAQATRTAGRPAGHAAFASSLDAGSHAVQLGSFSSETNARRAVEIFTSRYPQLRNLNMTITKAQVHGRNYWRVAVAGFSSGSARGMCSSVKARGGECFAYAARPGLPGSANFAIAGAGRARSR